MTQPPNLMPTPTDPLPPATLGAGDERCSVCAAALAPDQRYCLNCGQRRTEARVDYRALLGSASLPTGGSLPTQPLSGPTGPRTISPLGVSVALGLLLLAVLVGAVIGGRGGQQAAAAPVVLAAAATTPVATTATVAFQSDWTGADGWTVQLQVLDRAEATPVQIAEAKEAATSAGAAAVGALDSTPYPTLKADGYIVYSGVYASKPEAKRALKGLKASFPDAKLVEVSTTEATEAPAAAEAEAATEAPAATTEELKALEKSSPEDYVKKSKKLPDTVTTQGEPPPTDDQAPGGGTDDVTTIGGT